MWHVDLKDTQPGQHHTTTADAIYIGGSPAMGLLHHSARTACLRRVAFSSLTRCKAAPLLFILLEPHMLNRLS